MSDTNLWARSARRVWATRAKITQSIFALLVIFVIVASVAPSKSVPEVGSDKLGHFLAYAALQIIGGLAFPRPGSLWRLAASLTVLGAVLELVQSMIPSRDASWLDLAANTTGVVVGWAILAALPDLRRKLGAPAT